MKTTTIALVSLLVTLLAAGCAGGGHGIRIASLFRTHTDCDRPTCHLKVTVTATGPKSCKIDIDFEELRIKTKGPVKIVWTIPGPGSFVDRNGSGDGIDRKGNAQFQGRDHGRQQFKWDFANTRSDEHKYDINAELGEARCNRDPYVMN